MMRAIHDPTDSRRPRRRRRPRLLAVLAVALAVAWAGAARAGDGPTVAVVGFVSTNGPGDSVILGMADLLEAELSRYKVRVVSRRELNMLLGERGLARGGFTRPQDINTGALPWADFLLRGELRVRERHAPTLSVYLVDAASGVERDRWNAEIGRPEEAPARLTALAPRIVGSIRNRRVEALPPPQAAPGFTAIAEAALTFYRGLDHLVSGQPEYAVEYFRLAGADDPGFALATLGQAKAYDLLGFPSVAEALRRTIPAGRLPEVRAAGAGSVAIVRFVERGGAVTTELMDGIRARLRDAHGFTLFDPEWIPALTRETDLKLSGEFPLLHGLDGRLWLRADRLIVFSVEPAGRLRAHILDLMHGRLLGTVAGSAAATERLCAEVADRARRPPDAAPAAPAAPGPAVASTNAPPFRLTGTYSVDELAFALRRLSEAPKDLACWTHVLGVIQPEAGNRVVIRALLDLLEAAIPRESPDAPVWLAASCWGRYTLEARDAVEPPDLDRYFAPLLERYPDDLQAWVLRFHQAQIHFWRGNTEQAWPLAREAVERATPAVEAMHDFTPFRGLHLDVIRNLDCTRFPPALAPVGFNMVRLARDMYALGAHLAWRQGELGLASNYLQRAEAHETRVYHDVRVRRPGFPATLYAVAIGMWSIRHSDIGFAWQPADPADAGHMMIGWTFLPMPAGSARFMSTVVSAPMLMQLTRDALAAGTRPPPAGGELPVDVPVFGAAHRDPRAALQTFAEGSVRALALGGGAAQARHQRAFLTAYVAQLRAWMRETESARRAEGRHTAAPYDWRAYHDDYLRPAFGDRSYHENVLAMHWMTAGSQERAGLLPEARATCREAAEWAGGSPSLLSIRYLEARVAGAAGQAADAAGILLALMDDPRAQMARLELPEANRWRGLLYEECAALLETVAAKLTPAEKDTLAARSHETAGAVGTALAVPAAGPPVAIPAAGRFPKDAGDALARFAEGAAQSLERGGYAERARYARGYLTGYAAQVRAGRQAQSSTNQTAWGRQVAAWLKASEREARYGATAPPDEDENLLRMYWMTARAQERAGQLGDALATCREAAAWDVWRPIRLSIRYLEARLAHQLGQDFEASEILRALVDDPRSRETRLQLPETLRRPDTVYAESVALLARIRQTPAQPASGGGKKP